MATLSIDGGAERVGWAILEGTATNPIYLDSGLVTYTRKGKFQDYRLDLIQAYVDALTSPGSVFDQSFIPITEMVNEIVPAVGSFRGTQMYLANVAVTVVQSIATLVGIPIHQIGATTVHKKIAIGQAKKVSKVMVRNGVIEILPELAGRKKEWTKIFDEVDAIAIGLAHLGCNAKA